MDRNSKNSIFILYYFVIKSGESLKSICIPVGDLFTYTKSAVENLTKLTEHNRMIMEGKCLILNACDKTEFNK